MLTFYFDSLCTTSSTTVCSTSNRVIIISITLDATIVIVAVEITDAVGAITANTQLLLLIVIETLSFHMLTVSAVRCMEVCAILLLLLTAIKTVSFHRQTISTVLCVVVCAVLLVIVISTFCLHTGISSAFVCIIVCVKR